MAYLIEHFLRPGAAAATSGDPQFSGFTFDHTLTGEIEAQGEDPDDRWLLRVTENRVSVLRARLTYVDPRPVTTLAPQPR